MTAAELDVRVLFGPEHGFWGAAQDMVAVDSGEPGRVPVVSLYGATFEDLTPKPAHLAGLDVVVSDLPDVGSRYYTFVWTTALMMKACAARRIPRRSSRPAEPPRGRGRRGKPAGDAAPLLHRPLPGARPARPDAGGDRPVREPRVRDRVRPDRRPPPAGRRAAPAGRARPGPGLGPPVAEHADARDGARLPGSLPRGGDEPLRGARHDAPVRDRRRAVARRGPRCRRRERARDAGRRLSAARLQADVSEAGGIRLRRRPGSRDGRGRVPAVRDLSPAR